MSGDRKSDEWYSDDKNMDIATSTFWATAWHKFCPIGATCLPLLGNVLTPLGHAACPYYGLQSFPVGGINLVHT